MSIEIQTTGKGDTMLPYCPLAVYEDLKKCFNINSMLLTQHENNDVAIGYIRGALAVLDRVDYLVKHDKYYDDDEE